AFHVTGVQTCALPISPAADAGPEAAGAEAADADADADARAGDAAGAGAASVDQPASGDAAIAEASGAVALPEPEPDQDPTSLPALDFKVEDLRVGRLELGQAELQAHPGEDGLRVDRFATRAAGF